MTKYSKLKKELIDHGFIKYKGVDFFSSALGNTELFVFKFQEVYNDIGGICIYFSEKLGGFRIIKCGSNNRYPYYSKCTQFFLDMFPPNGFFDFASFEKIFELFSITNQKFALYLLFNKEIFGSLNG